MNELKIYRIKDEETDIVRVATLDEQGEPIQYMDFNNVLNIDIEKDLKKMLLMKEKLARDIKYMEKLLWYIEKYSKDLLLEIKYLKIDALKEIKKSTKRVLKKIK